MPSPIPISSPADARISVFGDLKNAAQPQRRGLFIAEGFWLVQRLLASPIPVHSVLVEEKRLGRIMPLLPPGIPVFTGSGELLSRVAGFDFHRGVLAAGYRPQLPSLQEGMQDAAFVLICPEINQVENLGAILRTAGAFDVGALLLGPSCCDPFARKALRASMGAAFQLRLCRSQHPDADIEWLKQNRFRVVAAVADKNARPLAGIRQDQPTALVLGSEAHGIDASVLAHCDQQLTIPIAAQSDSLNVVVAAGIFLYHFHAGTISEHRR